jgi:hypothetical protein
LFPYGFGLSYAQSDVPSIENPIFTIYPNPAKDFLVIRSEFPGSIEIFNSVGKSLQKNANDEFSSRIDLSELPNGIYIISVTNKKGTSWQKFVKI